MFILGLEHAGQQGAEEGQLGQRHIDAKNGVAEFAGTLARAGERTDIVEQYHLCSGPAFRFALGDDFVIQKPIDAAIQAQVSALRKLSCQLVLAIGVKQIELAFERVGAVEPRRAHCDIALPGRTAGFAQRFAVMAWQQAETGLDPALEHGGFASVGIEGPAAHHAQVSGLGALPGVMGGQARLCWLLQAEVGCHVADKTLRPFIDILDVVEQIEQGTVQGGDAVDGKRCWRPLEGQAAENCRGQIAAVDRQAGGQWQTRQTRQTRRQRWRGGRFLVRVTTNRRVDVVRQSLGEFLGYRGKPCHVRVSESPEVLARSVH